MSGASSSTANAATEPTKKGQWVSLELKYLEDKEEGRAQKQEPMPTYVVPSRPQDVYVEAINGKAYGIFVRNLSQESLCFKVLVDGQQVTTRCVHPGRVSDITSVVTSSRTVGDQVTEIRGSLIFKQVEIAEGTTLDRHAATSGKGDKLGSIEVEVWSTVKTTPRPCRTTVVDETSTLVLGGPVSAADGKKKGFGKSATGIGGVKTETTYRANNMTSGYCFGPNRYETVVVRYASRALLLLMGVPPVHFMNSNQNQTSVDLTDEGDKAKVRPSKRQRSTETSAPASAASASAPSVTTKTEPGVGGEVKAAVKQEAQVMINLDDDDDVVDLTT